MVGSVFDFWQINKFPLVASHTFYLTDRCAKGLWILDGFNYVLLWMFKHLKVLLSNGYHVDQRSLAHRLQINRFIKKKNYPKIFMIFREDFFLAHRQTNTHKYRQKDLHPVWMPTKMILCYTIWYHWSKIDFVRLFFGFDEKKFCRRKSLIIVGNYAKNFLLV